MSSAEAESRSSREPFPLINLIGNLIGKVTRPISFAEGYIASPSNITIGINEKINIEVGNCEMDTGNFSSGNDWFFLAERFLTFSAEVLDGNPNGVWFITFNPPTLNKTADILKSDATISLTSNPNAKIPLQSTIIRITVADTWVTKNLWFPENRDSYPIIGKNYKGFLHPMSPLGWFIGALLNGFGKNSGKIDTTYHYIDVLVKVKPFHAVKIEPLPPKRLSPNEVTSIPVLIENQGNYNDTFNFRVISETGYPIKATDNGTITLRPGEQGQAFVGIAVPPNALDTGTLHSLMLEVYSLDQPNTTIAQQRIFLETQGVYFSEQNSIFGLGAGIFLFLVAFILFYWRRKYLVNIGKKPEKPWKILEEQQHLAMLKRTDKNAYEQERAMMEDEYKSALLWYKENKIPLLKKLKMMPVKKKQKEKTKKKQPAIFKKPEKKPKKQIVKNTTPTEETLKQKALAKIKREQEKQLQQMK